MDGSSPDIPSQVLSDLLEQVLPSLESHHLLYTQQPLPCPSSPLASLHDLFLSRPLIFQKTLSLPSGQSVHYLQPRVYQQHLGYSCGYHSSCNLLQAVALLKQGHTYPDIDYFQALPYQMHLVHTTSFLLDYARRHSLDGQFWKEHKIIHQDFERTFSRVCFQQNRLFSRVVESAAWLEIHHLDLFIQFGWIQNEKEALLQCQRLFDRFLSHQADQVIAIQLGITCHWTSLVLHKRAGRREAVFFDSYNNQLLDLNEEQAQQFVQHRATQYQQKHGGKAFSSFQLLTQRQMVKDTQTILTLLLDMALGKDTLTSFLSLAYLRELLLEFKENLGLDLTQEEGQGDKEGELKRFGTFFKTIRARVRDALYFLQEDKVNKVVLPAEVKRGLRRAQQHFLRMQALMKKSRLRTETGELVRMTERVLHIGECV